MPQWMVKLAGDEMDLLILSRLYAEPACRVAKDDDGVYYLTRAMFDAMNEASAVESAVLACLPCIIADVQLSRSDFGPVSYEGVYSFNDAGIRVHHVLLQLSATGFGSGYLELTVLGPDGKPRPSPEPAQAQARLRLFERDERVREALDYSMRCSPDDADCLSYAYKISEIILEDLGGGNVAQGAKGIVGNGWSSDDQMQSFRETVHNREISGRKARHAATRRPKPGLTPMNEAEAIAYIKRVLRTWLDWKLQQES